LAHQPQITKSKLTTSPRCPTYGRPRCKINIIVRYYLGNERGCMCEIILYCGT